MAEGLDQGQLAAAISADRFEWRLHALARIAERGLLQQDVLKAVCDGEKIEDYPDSVPFSAALFLGNTSDDLPLHVVAAHDADDDFGYIITAYVPERNNFEPDWKTRRKL